MSESGGFSRAMVEALSARLDEPDWLRRRRLEAWERYEQTPFPGVADEDWRRVRFDPADLGELRGLPTANGATAAPDPLADGAAGSLHFLDGELVAARRGDALAAAGVVLCSLAEAVRNHEDLVRRYFMTAGVAPEESKYTLLHAALCNSGTFLYVPRGVSLDAPILSVVELSHGGVGTFHHTLVIAEDGAAVEVMELTRGGEGGAFSVPVAELFAGRGAHVGYHAVQNWECGAIEFASRRSVLGPDATGTLSDVALGGSIAKTFVGTVLEGQGAACKLYGLYFPEPGQQFDYTTLQDHRVPNCTSDLLFKGAVAERGRSGFRGVIRVHPDAQRTDAYQTNNNLLLGDDARADSMPVLEIEADDVKCSHGATLAHLDEEDLFYLVSRGLPRAVAQRLVIGGFFEAILEPLPSPALRERLQGQLAGRIVRRGF